MVQTISLFFVAITLFFSGAVEIFFGHKRLSSPNKNWLVRLWRCFMFFF